MAPCDWSLRGARPNCSFDRRADNTLRPLSEDRTRIVESVLEIMSALVNESGFVWGVPENVEWPPAADGWDVVAQNDWWMTAYSRNKPEERCIVQFLPYA